MKFEFNDDSQKICNSADVVNYGIQCDICGNKVLSVSNINGKRYCAGCYYKTFMKDNQKAEIDQLKQQLEESFTEEDVEGLIEDRDKTIKFLQKELAEKDKEIEKLKQQYTILENENGKLTTELIMDKYKKAQKEVSFGKQLAIQELEKVKVELRTKLHLLDSHKFGYSRHFVAWHDICDQINKQIKELKGEKDVED